MRNEILKLLETDSRLTVKDIAAMIGADEAAVEADIKAMEDESIICGYHTMIDWDKVGEEMVTAMIEVKVTPQREAGFDQIADRVRNFDEVHSVYLIAGAYDFMVVIQGKTLREISHFVSKSGRKVGDRTVRNPLSKTIEQIKPSGIRKFFDIVSEMPHAISLGVGEPDFDTPWHVRAEGIRSLEKGRTFYTSNSGLIELRQEICKWYQRKYNVLYDYKTEVLLTVGGSEGIDVALRAMLDPGDEVIIPEPCYVSYVPCVQLIGAVPVTIELKNENQFRLTPEELLAAITDKTKILILAFPSNPTGAVMTKEDLEPIAKICQEKDIYVISDEIYSELTYGGQKHCSISSLPGMKDRTIVINGFSKAYAMTGWRLGYALAPEVIAHQMTKQISRRCASRMIRDAGSC